MVGGINPVLIDMTEAAHCIAPDASRQSPVMDFIALIGIFFARSPRAFFMTVLSILSPLILELALAYIKETSFGLSPAPLRAMDMALTPPPRSSLPPKLGLKLVPAPSNSSHL